MQKELRDRAGDPAREEAAAALHCALGERLRRLKKTGHTGRGD